MTRRTSARGGLQDLVMGCLALLLLVACTPAPDTKPAATGTASPSPLASPRPTLAAQQIVYVAQTNGQGADFRQAPGASGVLIRVVPDGAALEAAGREQQVDDQTWSEVRDLAGTPGWVLRELLSPTPPPLATPTPMPDVAPPTPVQIPVPVIATRAPAGPRPTDTLVPIAPLGPQAPPAPVPPAPTERATPPVPIPPLAPLSTPDDSGEGTGLTRCQDGTATDASGPGACSGHGGIGR